jgi:hypothetical protein
MTLGGHEEYERRDHEDQRDGAYDLPLRTPECSLLRSGVIDSYSVYPASAPPTIRNVVPNVSCSSIVVVAVSATGLATGPLTSGMHPR